LTCITAAKIGGLIEMQNPGGNAGVFCLFPVSLILSVRSGECLDQSNAAKLVRACATAIGLAGFAVLASYSVVEIYGRIAGSSPAYVQLLTFQCAQVAFAFFGALA
jgi:hypothetical protein